MVHFFRMSLIPNTQVAAFVVEHRRCHGSFVASSVTRRHSNSHALLSRVAPQSRQSGPPQRDRTLINQTPAFRSKQPSTARKSHHFRQVRKLPFISRSMVGTRCLRRTAQQGAIATVGLPSLMCRALSCYVHGYYYSGACSTGVLPVLKPTKETIITCNGVWCSCRALLPSTCVGWGRSVTANEELYYVNHITKSTTWSRPQWMGSDGEDNCEFWMLRP